MNIRLRQLRAFKAIVETGSVSEASIALGLTQSSVSKLLARFESELGFQLFDRAGRRLRLSEQGRMFLEKAGNAIELVEDIRTAATDIRDNQGLRLRVCAIGPLAFSRLIPETLARFSARFPDFTFSIEMRPRIEIEDWVLHGHSDIGFTLFPVDRGQLRSRSLATVRAVAIAPVNHQLAGRKSISPVDLADADVVMPKSSVRLRGLVEAGFVQAGISLRPRFETTSAISTVNIVAQGVGIAIVDPFSLSGIPRSNIRVIKWQPDTALDYGMVWSAFRQLTSHENEFFLEARSVAENIAKSFGAPEAG